MKIILIVGGVLLITGIGFFAFTHDSSPEQSETTKVVVEENQAAVSENEEALVEVTPISHATMILKIGEVIIYTDPVGGEEAFAGQPAADIVLLTDIHGDHLSTSALEAIVGTNATLIVPQAVKDLLPPLLAARATVVGNTESITEQGITITAVPMYNLPETADSRHAKGRGNGYILALAATQIYIAGDTGPIPEMKALTDIDMAFVPMNLPYTMSVEEAAEAVLAFAPTTVYPYHYRQPDGLADVAKFKALVEASNPAIEVKLLEWYQPE